MAAFLRLVLLPCAMSLVLYALVFALVLDRPLSHGFLRERLEAKLDRGASIEGRKLVIIAGSNGPYSHRCEAMEPILGVPCVNAGVAVGIGLDYLFARWQPLLRAGDVVYLPLEQAQYVRARTAIRLGPDAAIMLRHDRTTLGDLPADRRIAALFAFDLRAVVMSGLEMALAATGFHDPRAEVTGSMNAWGDQVGHTQAIAAANASILAAARPIHVTPEAVRDGDGAAEVRRFLGWAADRGVVVVGGFPTGFADTPIPPATAAAIRALYQGPPGHARFLDLPDQGRYPRSWFFDTPDHLHQDAQIAHSRRVAVHLRGMLAPPGGDDGLPASAEGWRDSAVIVSHVPP